MNPMSSFWGIDFIQSAQYEDFLMNKYLMLIKVNQTTLFGVTSGSNMERVPAYLPI